jgi:hypothetical protein
MRWRCGSVVSALVLFGARCAWRVRGVWCVVSVRRARSLPGLTGGSLAGRAYAEGIGSGSLGR